MVDLQPDCANCAGLCCMALAFDKGEMFAFDKPAGKACRHLGEDFRCTIHNALDRKGLKGCTLYSCDGAGQRVIQEVFKGASWEGSPELKHRMLDAFKAMREVHKHLGLLRAAQNLPLGGAQLAELVRLQTILTPADKWSEDTLNHFQTSGVLRDFKAFYKSLRAH